MTKTLRAAFKAAVLATALIPGLSPATIAWAQSSAPVATTAQDAEKEYVTQRRAEIRMLTDQLRKHTLPPQAEYVAVDRLRALSLGAEPNDVRMAAFSHYSRLAGSRGDLMSDVIDTALILVDDSNSLLVGDIFYFLRNAVPQPGPDSDKVMDLLRSGVEHQDKTVSSVAAMHLSMMLSRMPLYREQIVDIALPHVLHYSSSARNSITGLLKAALIMRPEDGAKIIDVLKNAGYDHDLLVEYESEDRGMGYMGGGGTTTIPAYTHIFDTLMDIATTQPSPHDAVIHAYFAKMADPQYPADVRRRAMEKIEMMSWWVRGKFAGEAMTVAEKNIHDPSSEIRSMAEQILEEVIEFSPENAYTALKILEDSLYKEKDADRRAAKVGIIGDIGKQYPQFMHITMGVLIGAAHSDSEDVTVRVKAVNKMAALFPTVVEQRPNFFFTFLLLSEDKPEPLIRESIAGLRAAVTAEPAYSAQVFAHIKKIQPLHNANPLAREQIARTYGAVFSADPVNADESFRLLTAMRHDATHGVRNAVVNTLVTAAQEQPAAAPGVMSVLTDMTRYRDDQTRNNTVKAFGKIGAIDSQTKPAMDILKGTAYDLVETVPFRAASMTEIGNIALARPPFAGEGLSIFEGLLSDPETAIVKSALDNIVRVSTANGAFDQRVMDTLAPFENAKETTLKNAVSKHLKYLRDTLGFQNLRNAVNDEAALSVRLPDALKDPALAADLLPQAIALLENAKEDPTLRLKAADIVGPLGHAHASLAVPAATALASVIGRDEPGNNPDSLRAMLQKTGMIGITHESAAPIAIAAAALLTAKADATLPGMAVTAIGLMGAKYPSAAPAAAAALCPVAARGDALARTARMQMDKMKPPAQCPAP